MNIDAFAGRAQAYTNARPGYPPEAIDYICNLMPQNATIADVGAGTGKFTELIAAHGYETYAVEPSREMREQLVVTLSPFNNAKIINGTAENTTLSSNSIDVVTCAQTLNRVDVDKFATECRRIGKASFLVISLFNYERGNTHSISRYKKSTGSFFQNPIVREFSNSIYFSLERWMQYHHSMEGVPQEADVGYEDYFATQKELFDHNSEDGLLLVDFVTNVTLERGVGAQFKH